MWHLLLFAACILLLAIVVSRITTRRTSGPDSFVCDRCGEKDCICRKEDAS